MKSFLEWLESVASVLDMQTFLKVKSRLVKWLRDSGRIQEDDWFALKAKPNQDILAYFQRLDASTGGEVSRTVGQFKVMFDRAMDDSRAYGHRMNKPAFMSPEEVGKWKDIGDANGGASGPRATGRYTKSLFVSKADQAKLSRFTYVHWCKEEDAEKFLDGRISGRSEMSVRIYSDISKVGDRSMMWQSGYGIVLKGFVTAFGEDDLSSDNRQHAPDGQKPQQKYVGKPHLLDPSGSFNPEDKKANEALIDNWRIVGLVAPRDGSEEIVKKAKEKGVQVHFV